jgi:hypothetical protein
MREAADPMSSQIHTVYACAIPERLFNPDGINVLQTPFFGRYSPFISLSDPPGDISLGYSQASITLGATSAYEDDLSAPGGQGVLCTVDATDAPGDLLRFSISLDPLAYQGRYRIFMRYHTDGGGSEVIRSYTEIITAIGISTRTESITLNNSVSEENILADYGVLEVPPYSDEKMHFFPPEETTINVYMTNTGPGIQSIKAIDMIIWPADNRMGFTATLRSPTYTSDGLRNGYFLQTDSIYKNRTSSYLRKNASDDPAVGAWITDSATAILLPHDEAFRLYFFCVDMQDYPSIIRSYARQTLSIKVSGARRYATTVGRL